MSKNFVSLKMAAEAKGQGVSTEKNYKIDPKIIEVESGFNRPISREHVSQLKLSIKSGATIPPIVVRVDNGRVFLVDGEHRHIAVMELISEGIEIESMSAINFRGNDADRVAHLLTSSQGMPLNQLESGIQYIKLLRFGWDKNKISQRVGKTCSHVDSCIILAESDSNVHLAVSSGEISPTLAIDEVRKHGSNAGLIIAEKLVIAKSNGKTKVTASTDRKSPSKKELEKLAKAVELMLSGKSEISDLRESFESFRMSF